MNLRPIGQNQNEVIIDRCSILFSYRTPVAYIDNKTGQAYQTNKKWSKTTSRHINKWLDGQSSGLVDQSVLDSLLDKIEYQILNENVPCSTCKRIDLPLHTDYKCPNCSKYSNEVK